jgi:L,D-transpeptidase ErfK/SrfK
MMDSLEQGYSRLLKKKQRKEISLSKQIALVQYIMAMVVSLSVLLFLLWFGLQYEYDNVTVASSAQHNVIMTHDSAAGPSYLNTPKMEFISNYSIGLKGASPACRIVINLPSRTLDFYAQNSLVKTYPLAIGKPSTPTPIGNFTIRQKEVNPWWYPPRSKKAVPPGPNNPLGYRWMEFAPLYGIHGTNAPWAIGGWVSNGCVRMDEADVEELFDLVPFGTAVYIHYDLARIEMNAIGQVSLGIYPDVYSLKRQSATVREVEQKMLEAGVPNFANEKILEKIINKKAGQQVPLFQIYKLKVNGTLLPGQIVASQGQLFIPIWKVAAFFHGNVVWDEQQQLVYSNNQVVPGVVKGEILYVLAQDVQSLFGGMWLWQQADNSWNLSVPTIGKQ